MVDGIGDQISAPVHARLLANFKNYLRAHNVESTQAVHDKPDNAFNSILTPTVDNGIDDARDIAVLDSQLFIGSFDFMLGDDNLHTEGLSTTSGNIPGYTGNHFPNEASHIPNTVVSHTYIF